jgi:hypothetical protein
MFRNINTCSLQIDPWVQRKLQRLYTLPMSSDFVTHQRLKNLHFAKSTLLLVYGQEITTRLFNGFI